MNAEQRAQLKEVETSRKRNDRILASRPKREGDEDRASSSSEEEEEIKQSRDLQVKTSAEFYGVKKSKAIITISEGLM